MIPSITTLYSWYQRSFYPYGNISLGRPEDGECPEDRKMGNARKTGRWGMPGRPEDGECPEDRKMGNARKVTKSMGVLTL